MEQARVLAVQAAQQSMLAASVSVDPDVAISAAKQAAEAASQAAKLVEQAKTLPSQSDVELEQGAASGGGDDAISATLAAT